MQGSSLPVLSSEKWDAFFKELDLVGREAREAVGDEDFRHLRRLERIGRLASLVGYATAWIVPNPISMWLISQGIMTRWLLMHHIGHQAYDNIPGIPARYTSAHFGIQRRRWLDWPDWMLPEAWNYEHNRLHHFNLNETHDPDLVQRNSEWLRQMKLPRSIAWSLVIGLMVSWKWFYYAPSTLAELRNRQAQVTSRRVRPQAGRPSDSAVGAPVSEEDARVRAKSRTLMSWDVWKTCLIPYSLLRFGVIPALFLPLGVWAWASVLVNSIVAELITNVHTFIVIVPNHAGHDMPFFREPTRSWREYQVRQILGSVNYRTGGDVNDFHHMWLNYQIEHHVWPKLTMLGYQRVQPKLKALCDTYGVPYIQQSVWTRLRRTFEVMLGDNAMPDVAGQVVVTDAATVAVPGGVDDAPATLVSDRSPELALA